MSFNIKLPLGMVANDACNIRKLKKMWISNHPQEEDLAKFGYRSKYIYIYIYIIFFYFLFLFFETPIHTSNMQEHVD